MMQNRRVRDDAFDEAILLILLSRILHTQQTDPRRGGQIEQRRVCVLSNDQRQVVMDGSLFVRRCRVVSVVDRQQRRSTRSA